MNEEVYLGDTRLAQCGARCQTDWDSNIFKDAGRWLADVGKGLVNAKMIAQVGNSIVSAGGTVLATAGQVVGISG